MAIRVSGFKLQARPACLWNVERKASGWTREIQGDLDNGYSRAEVCLVRQENTRQTGQDEPSGEKV